MRLLLQTCRMLYCAKRSSGEQTSRQPTLDKPNLSALILPMQIARVPVLEGLI
jgi:hypothetical protein